MKQLVAARAFQLANYERDGGIAALITGDLATVETRLGKRTETFLDFLANWWITLELALRG
jgi:hypothetical protein